MRRRASSDRVPLPPGFWTIWSTVAVDLLGFGIILPILALYTERFGAGPITIGLLVASFSLAQMVCAPLLGRLSDRIGRKPVILISLFGTALGSFVTGAAVGVWMLFLGRIIDGASGASVSVAQGAITDVAPPDQRARLLGLLGAAFGVGFVIGPALGGLAALVGERVPFYLAGVIALVNALVAIRRLPETHGPRRTLAAPAETIPATGPISPASSAPVVSAPVVPAPASTTLPATTSPAASAQAPPPISPSVEPEPVDSVPAQRRRKADLIRLAVIAFTATAAFSGFEATFALLGQERFSLTEGSVAVVFVCIGLALVVVQAGLIRPVTARFGTNGTLRMGLVFNAFGLFALAFATTWWLLVPALALLVAGQGFSTPTLSAAAANRAREESRGAALGFLQSAGSLARVIGPAVAGILFHVAIPLPYLLGTGLMAIALALLAATRLPESGGAHGGGPAHETSSLQPQSN